ncbi:SMC family ATPase [Nocardiopsis sp. EMB25]|uniref:AAA family ATPase n=1 Tax=Nocardiopsis sp. EMB25 TaxID=2835867 RepID=UPI00228497C5|nr:SMC family ATPase [Nocardiopsis sp. EMB25]MCY9782615.1 SMC family ATPase [Nocardiopsis sp. EMB25]
MRLHTLTVRAFGPFADTELVDFDHLSAGGLFLIHGPTGAGKTSVLDAVCFALYGRVPGARRDDRSPKSDHAPLDRVPEVTLECTIRGRRVRIERRPRWERPKKRGSGTRTENAKVVVTERVNGRWEGVTTRPDEAGQFVGDLLGLTLDQFCQVAMLPQGDFARFLRARAEERRESLERIFNTRVFRDVEEWFKGHANRLRLEVESANEHVRSVAGRISEAGRSDPPDLPEELSAWAAELAAVTAATSRDAALVAAEATESRDAAQTALTAGRQTRARQDRLTLARRRRDELSRGAEERSGIDVRLAAAERAGTVLPFLRARDHRRTELDKAELTVAERSSLVRALPGVGDMAAPGDTAERAPAVLSGAERERRDELARLELLRGDAERRDSLGAQVAGFTRRLGGVRAEIERVRERITSLPPQIEKATGELRQVRDQAGLVEAAQAALEAAQRRLEAAGQYEFLGRELIEAEDGHRAAVDAAQDAQDHALRLRERRITHMAAELAGKLTEGDPCAVCGSLDHPAPARPAEEGLVSAEQEEAAQTAAGAADARRSQARAHAAALRERRAAALDRAEGLTPASAREEVASRTRALEEARTAAVETRRLEETLEQLTADLDRARAEEGELTRSEARLETDRANAAAEHTRLTELLDGARGDDPGIGQRISRLAEEADLLRAAADAVHDRDRAAEELRMAVAEAERQRAEAGFAAEADVWEAALDDRRRRELRDRARAFDDDRAAVEAALADPDLVAAGTAPVPDLESLADAADHAAAAADHAVAWRSTLEERARRLVVLRGELDRALEGCEPVLRRYAVAEGMRALAAGTSADNADNVRLSAYVLASRLEQVVAAANDRLRTMSDGRYELRYTVDKAAGDGRARSAGGLGMRVVDAWTGVERDPATLSGGETFFSSLALALGLGDVASAEAGGTDIDTLFVDEGFGTLDEDTLEEVLDVLDRLRDGGRAVGVVSHVADLRQRVGTRLRVIKGASGSRVEHT